MIHALCDFCGKDCDRNAILLTLTPFSNFARYHIDTEPCGVKDAPCSFVMCSNCRKKHDLPNPYGSYARITEHQLSYGTHLDNYDVGGLVNGPDESIV